MRATAVQIGAHLGAVVTGVCSGPNADFIPVGDRTYPFEQIIDAHEYVDRGHKHGSVAITVAS